MDALLEAGVHRKDSTVKEVVANGDTATAKVLQKDFGSGAGFRYMLYTVSLVRQGGYWRVKNFAGGRNVLENNVPPGMIEILSQEEVEGPGAGGAAGGEGTGAVATEGGAAAGPIDSMEAADQSVEE